MRFIVEGKIDGVPPPPPEGGGGALPSETVYTPCTISTRFAPRKAP